MGDSMNGEARYAIIRGMRQSLLQILINVSQAASAVDDLLYESDTEEVESYFAKNLEGAMLLLGAMADDFEQLFTRYDDKEIEDDLNGTK